MSAFSRVREAKGNSTFTVGSWALQGIAPTLAMVFAISPSLFPLFYSYVAVLRLRSLNFVYMVFQSNWWVQNIHWLGQYGVNGQNMGESAFYFWRIELITSFRNQIPRKLTAYG
jgi:hypothetical protein